MPYNVKVLLDSKCAETGKRITTFELTYPRFIHSEFMTHRMFSRNSSSSRAIPIQRLIDRVIADPVIPVYWGVNQKGMQANEELSKTDIRSAMDEWLKARDSAVHHAQNLVKLKVHKQLVNRLLEPWMWITVICTATEYANFFNLRCHPDAQPEMQRLAYMMLSAYRMSIPATIHAGEWHLPFVNEEDRASHPLETLLKLSTARCARVSYLTHDGVKDIDADIGLHNRLSQSGHWSPFEHQALAMPSLSKHHKNGNFVGYEQYRKTFTNENRRDMRRLLEAA